MPCRNAVTVSKGEGEVYLKGDEMRKDFDLALSEGRRLYEIFYGPLPYGCLVYHVNGNIWDNDPSNLIAIPIGYYRSIQASGCKPSRATIEFVRRRYGYATSKRVTRKSIRRAMDRELLRSAKREALRNYPKHKRIRSTARQWPVDPNWRPKSNQDMP